MSAYGDAKQSIIWFAAVDELGRDEMVELMVLSGGITQESANRYWNLMRSFYEKRPGTKRTGEVYMPVFWDGIESLVPPPPEIDGIPLARPITEENFVGGTLYLQQVLTLVPDYLPAEFVNASGTDLFGCFEALASFAYGSIGGLDRFALLEGDVYQIFLGTSDTVFPGDLLPKFGESLDPDPE